MAVEAAGLSRHSRTMPVLGLPDIIALAWFLGAWIIYSIVIEKSSHGGRSLNALMHTYRDDWMDRMLGRELRMVDAQVTAALQNGAAFFASTSLLAIGGALTLMRASDDIMPMMSVINFGSVPSRQLWEFKMLGLVVIFVYAFFKFAWSYRLFNYFAIMVGAAPPTSAKDTPAAKAFAHRAARMCEDAGRQFNRGQRAFFFALGYLGWLLGPILLMITTTGVVVVMWRRQFTSESRKAFDPEAPSLKAAKRPKPSPYKRRQ
jgi:uncharacterized membrane protein